MSNRATTAEDTWMNSITVGQKNHTLPGSSTNVMKTAGSDALGYVTGKKHDGVSVDPDSRVGPSAVQHAYNNAATQRASVTLHRRYGLDYTVPAVATQESAWLEARREGGKDPIHNAALRDAAAEAAPKKTGRSGEFKQGTLF